jgi:O-acetyl-ADP-ribose deacetylase (regulator of RNase III)
MNDPRIRALRADITRLDVDAIINAANETLLGGGGVDGAIHRAAGPKLLAACRALPQVRAGVRCPTGEARITPGFLLPARHVIHTVGPVWNGGASGEAELLASCYRNVLRLAREHKLRSLAFPAISCGIFGYPVDAATRIAVREIRRALALAAAAEEVLIACFNDDIHSAYTAALAAADDDA